MIPRKRLRMPNMDDEGCLDEEGPLDKEEAMALLGERLTEIFCGK
jgi:hypothetical protein